MRVIGLCGKTGSGKDTVARMIARLHAGNSNAHHDVCYKHSDVLRRMLEANGQPVVPQRMSDLFEAIAGQLGYGWLARQVVADIERDAVGEPYPAEPRVIVGIRNVTEVALYRERFGAGFRLVAVHASQARRYDRVRNRGERANEHDMPWEEFLALEALCAHTQEDAVIARADLRLENEDGLDSLAIHVTSELLSDP